MEDSDECQTVETVPVLLVEDNPRIRELETDFLDSAGMRVRCVSNAAQALEYLLSAPETKLMITDVAMSEMNGVELAHRALEERPGLRILFVSGFAAANLRLEKFPAGSVAFLQKPFSPRDLEANARQLLSR